MEQVVPESEINGSKIIDLYKCSSCTEVFSDEETLKAHNITHEIILNNRCQSCAKQFKSSYEMRYHNCIKKFICSICGDTLESLQKKKKHEEEHYHDEHGYVCEVCGKIFKHKYNMDQHCESQHFRSTKEFSCSQCPKKFKFKTRLDYHSRSSHPVSTALNCEDCNITFKSSIDLKQHNIHKHSGINAKVNCLECNVSVFVHSLKKHMDSHKVQEKKKTVFCGECSEPFATPELLKSHEEMNCHIECQSCHSIFPSQFLYKKHRLIAHSDKRETYTCQYCDKVFITLSEKTRHLVTHSTYRLFKCNVCGFQSKFRDNLKKHVLNMYETQ